MDERELQVVMWLVLEEKEAEETMNACTRGRVHFRHFNCDRIYQTMNVCALDCVHFWHFNCDRFHVRFGACAFDMCQQ